MAEATWRFSKGIRVIVDLIVPARDEQENIAALLWALPNGLLRRVVVVDNGSSDATGRIAAENGAVVVREERRGYGAACLAGLAWVEAQDEPPEAVAFIDADLADDPVWLAELIRPIAEDRADLVIGCRSRLAEPGALTPVQRFGNALACGLIGLLTGRRYRDLGPMRVVRWLSLKDLVMRDRTWGWTVEMQFKAARLGQRVVEVDVPYRRRLAGRSKISGTVMGSFRAGWKILGTIAVLWWRTRGAVRARDHTPLPHGCATMDK